MKNNYRIAILYFGLFSLLMIGSGFWIFILKSGFTFEGMKSYYAPKSYEGILKIAQPHLLSIGIFIMVSSHFFLFSKYKSSMSLISKILYISAFVMITSTFGIDETDSFFILLKAIALIIFILISLLVSFKLLLVSSSYKMT